jgi:pentatricopeptide repeat protein
VLWLDDNLNNPAWVQVELAAMAPGSVQSSNFSFNLKLAKYVKAGRHAETLRLFQQLQQEQGMIPDRFSFVPVLNACAGLRMLLHGRCIHAQIMQSRCESDVYICNSLVDMYAKCGSMEDAERVFDKMGSQRGSVAWNALILGHLKCGQAHKALALCEQMQQEGVALDAITFVGILNACARVAALEKGRCAHAQIIESGFESNVFVGSSLVDMYAKCGSLEEAQRVFDSMPIHNVVSWNAMILGHVKNGHGRKALEMYQLMQLEGLKPSSVTFAAVLNACASVKVAVEEGRYIHEQAILHGCESDPVVGNCLIDMYAKCGSMEDAWRVFNRMQKPHSVISWSAMILGYLKREQGYKVLELSREMQREGVQPDPVTFVGLLNACASVVALEEGRHFHEQIIDLGCESDHFVASSLVDMYAKCGSIYEAQMVFNRMSSPNVVSWTVMLQGYATHGLAKEALAHFKQMWQQAIAIDKVTFVALLSGCSHAGLVHEGLHYFESMGSLYGVSATMEHYACVVDLLGRAGHLQEAEDFINAMSCAPDTSVWTTLLGACRIHGNVEMAERITKKIVC